MFDQNGWAKVEMGAFVYLDDSCDEFAKASCILSVYYVRLMDNRICKVITDHNYHDRKIALFGYRYDILEYSNLEFDSNMIECGRPVLNDWSIYADSFSPRPEIRILEPSKLYYDKAVLCFVDALPDDVACYVNDEVGFEYAI